MSLFWIIVLAVLYVAGMLWYIKNDEEIWPMDDDDILDIIVGAILCAFWPLSWAIKVLLGDDE